MWDKSKDPIIRTCPVLLPSLMGTSYKFYYIEFTNYKEAIQIFICGLIEVYNHIYCDINLFVWCGTTCNNFNIFSQNIIKNPFWQAIKVMALGNQGHLHPYLFLASINNAVVIINKIKTPQCLLMKEIWGRSFWLYQGHFLLSYFCFLIFFFLFLWLHLLLFFFFSFINAIIIMVSKFCFSPVQEFIFTSAWQFNSISLYFFLDEFHLWFYFMELSHMSRQIP